MSEACVYGDNEENEMLHSDQIGEPLIRTQLYLSTDQREVLMAEARQMNISFAEIVRRILDKHVRRLAKN
jgi:hypothetical protein